MRKALLVALPLAGLAVAAGLGVAVATQGADVGGATGDTPSATSGATTGSGPAHADAGPETTTPRSDASSTSSVPDAPSTSAASSPAGQKTPVQVVLGYAGWERAGQVEAGGFVSSVVELGGRCTLTLSRGGVHVDATVEAEPDATTTNCGMLTIPGGKLSPGDWQATLTYQSATSYGASQPMTVTVPAA